MSEQTMEADQALWRDMSSMAGTAASDLCRRLVTANQRIAELEAALRKLVQAAADDEYHDTAPQDGCPVCNALVAARRALGEEARGG